MSSRKRLTITSAGTNSPTQPVLLIGKSLLASTCGCVHIGSIGIRQPSTVDSSQACTHTEIISFMAKTACRIHDSIGIGYVAAVDCAGTETAIPVVSPFAVAGSSVDVARTVDAIQVALLLYPVPPVPTIAVAVSEVVVTAIAVRFSSAVRQGNGSACRTAPGVVCEALAYSCVEVATVAVLLVRTVQVAESRLPSIISEAVASSGIDVGCIAAYDR